MTRPLRLVKLKPSSQRPLEQRFKIVHIWLTLLTVGVIIGFLAYGVGLLL